MTNKKYFNFIVILVLMLCTALGAQAEHDTLLDGKKWSQYGMSSGTTLLGGNLQGAAYYDGKIYSFKQVNGGTTSTNNYNVYDIATNTWTPGAAITCAPNTHMGSAAFAPNVVSSYEKNGTTYNCTIPFVFVSGHGTMNPDGTLGSTKYIYCAVVDIENNQLITRFAFPNRYDDCILSYDFNYTNNTTRVWVLGYPSKSLGQATDVRGKSPYIIEEYQISNDILLSLNPSKTEFTHGSSEYKGMMQGGGPNAEGIQESLECGTIQDMFYHDNHLYVCTGRGSEYNRTEFVKVQCYDVTPGNHHVEETIVTPEYGEAQGIVYDGTNIWVLNTGGTGKMWKLSEGSGYDNFNFQQPAEVSPATTPATYNIANGSELCWFLQQVYAGRTTINAKLTKDIDLSGITLPTSFYVYMDQAESYEKGFDAQYAFRGTFDGEGHSITNLSITKTPYYNNGLFPYCIGATIRNVDVSGTITPTTCRTQAGSSEKVANIGMIGYMDGGTISNVDVSGITITDNGNAVDGTTNKLIGHATGDIIMSDVTGVDAYTITWKDNDESTIKQTQVLAGNVIVAPADPVKEGYNFNAWNPVFSEGTTASADATYTATYEVNPYDSNGFKTSGTSADADYYQPAKLVDGYYEIDNAGKMFWFAKQVNAGNGTINAKVTKDIDMCGNTHTDFPGIGYYISGADNKALSGNFDGQGHRIYNCNITSTTGGWGSGLIAHADGASKFIKDFTLEGTITAKCNSYAGGALGYIARGYTVSGITSSVTFNSSCIKSAGVVGFINQGSISKCRFNGTLNASNSWVGGIVGELAANVTMSNCLFDGTINSTYDKNDLGLGGITALPKGNTITGCLVYGTIITTETAKTSANIGKVFGRVDGKLTLTNVYYGEKAASTPTNLYNQNGKTITGSVTYIGDTPDWETIKNTLGTENWGINTQVYPVPGEKDCNVKITITFNTNGGTVIAPIKQEAGTEITAPEDPSKTGYKFAGWDKAIPGVMPEEDVTITAQWTVNQYTISFDMNGATSAQIASITQDYGTTITKPTNPTRDGWFFNGWTPAIPSTMPAEDITCEAQWSQDSYNNGFNTNSSCATANKYEEPVLLTEARCTELGIATTYATNDYFEVKNAGNMYWIAQNISNVNNTRKYVMTADIDMDGTNHKDWAGIGKFVNGNSDYNFKGTFDGNGKKFTNYYMKVTGSNSWKGMFCVPNGATIKNFSIFGNIEIASTGTQIGAIGGRITGTTIIEDIHSAVNITVEAGKTPASIGGLIGQCSATTTFNRCRYSGTITGNSAYKNLGGIFGNAESMITINNCLFDGTITSTSTKVGSGDDAIQIGGVGGRNNNKTTITNCLMNGTVTVDANSEAVDQEKTHSGIIFGYQKTTADLTITNTYYSTSKCTSGIRAVGLSEATNSSKANPTALNNESATTLRVALGTENWKMVNGITEYPVPGTGGPAVQVVTITFDTKGGSAITPISGTEGEAVTAPANPSKEGHDFAGWVDAQGKATSIPTVMPSANLTIYASWNVKQYTITFDTDGGSTIDPITLNYGATITAPAAPTKEDWEFNGWSPVIPTTMPAYDQTVKAQWIQETYNNGFNTDTQCAASVKYQRAKGSGTVADPYLIDNGGKLWWFANQVKTDKTLCAKLTAETIDVECATRGNMPQMGEWGAPYKGTFDGQGNTISGWQQTWSSSSSRSGLFGYTENATIKNFTLVGEMTVNGSQQHGSVVGYTGAGTTVEDIWSKVNITAEGTAWAIGGVVGRQNGTANRCRYSGTITCATGVYNGIGGVIGETYGGTTNNCLFDGTIIAPSSDAKLRVGGIVGYQTESTASTVKNCLVNGTITVTNYSTATSGIVFGGLNATNVRINANNIYYTNNKVSAKLDRAAGISNRAAMGHCENVTGKSCLTDGYLVKLLGNGNWKQDVSAGYPVPCKGTATEGLDANGFSYAKDGTHDFVTENGEWYEIANGGQLLDFAEKVNAGTIALSSKARLTEDIDLEWCDFPGIGDYSSSKKFQGTFDGQGHTIRGMYRQVQGSAQRKGMFNFVENATIKNFTVEGEIQVHEGGNSTFFIGGVVGIGDTAGTLEDVTSSVDINVINGGETTRIIGGVAGRFKGTLNRCRDNGTMDLGTNTAQQIGGVLASAEVTTMSNCLFDGKIVAASSNAAAEKVVIGGLLGIDNNAVTIKNCLSNGTITLTNSPVTDNVGAVWGQITKASTSTVTYYTTTGITKGGAALNQAGGANASSNMATTSVGESSLADITLALNNNSTAFGNWQIVEGQAYPIPSYFSHDHSYDAYGICTVCSSPEPIGEPVAYPDGKSYYHIDHLGDLEQFAALVNTSPKGTEINAKATKDIDLTGHAKITTTIGDKNHPYCGTFDGQGHTMKGIRVETDSRYVGLFGCVGITDANEANIKHGIVKNFSVSGTVTATYFSTWKSNTPLIMGVIGEVYDGTVENVHSTVNFTCTSGVRCHIGGVVGGSLKGSGDVGEVNIRDCTYDGTMTLNAVDCIGGIVGYMQHHTNIYDCMYSGTINQNYTRPSNEEDTATDAVSTYIGGILGYTNSGSNGVQNTLVLGDFSTNLTPETKKMAKGSVNMNIGVGYDGMLTNANTPSIGNYMDNYVPTSVTKKYHQLPTETFEDHINVRPDVDFVNGAVCAELNANENFEEHWGQILGYQTGSSKDPNSPAQKAPYPGYTDPEQTTYKVVRTPNAEDNTKYDYTADYYFFDDYGDTTPYPSDAASMKVKKVEYTRQAAYMTDYISMCLPWEFTEEMKPSGDDTKCYKYSSTDGSTVKFAEIKEFPIAAGTPFIMYVNPANGADWKPTFNQTETPIAVKVNNPADGESGLFGTFDTMKPGKWSESNLLYKLHSDGSVFVRTTDNSNVFPFRVWLKLATTSNNAREHFPVFVDEDVTTSIPDVELQFNDADGSSHIYNLNGQRTGTDAHGILIINGRKVIK